MACRILVKFRYWVRNLYSGVEFISEVMWLVLINFFRLKFIVICLAFLSMESGFVW